jgi:hypothetical protein
MPAERKAPGRAEVVMNLAFVLLAEARFPDAEEIVRSFSSFTPAGHTISLCEDDEERSGEREIAQFELSSGGAAFVAMVPIAVPEGEADEGARFSVSALGTGWELPEHSAHLMVTLQTTEGSSVIDELSCFTSLLAAVAEVSGAVGIYWGNAGATHNPELFIDVAREPELAPKLLLWTGVSVAREADGRLSLLSLGMQQLNLPNLLLVSSSEDDPLETFFDLLAYVAQRGEAIPDGDTVGRSARERLKVRYVQSPVDPEAKVWRVELP